MSLSLVPYHPREGREIVLRHHDAIVVRDPSSQRLEIRGLTACPTCHQPLRPSSPERSYDAPSHQESFVDPDYFRMLRAGHGLERPDRAPPASPTRRLVQPFFQDEQGAAAPVQHIEEEAEFISSTPDVHEGSRIRREAFSPRYFKTFFVEERELGRGGKGIVLLVRHEIDGCHLGHFACKRVPVGDDHAWLEKVLIEVELLAKLSHPNLVSYRHVWLEDVRLTRFGPPVACAFILQQYCNSGDLLHYVAGDQPKETTKEELKAQMRRRSKGQIERTQDIFPGQRQLPLEEIYSLFRDITAGLAYLHAANYIHRDLKPSNCLLHREGKSLICLISDFGEVQPENAVRKSTGSTGTISYCAPEVLRRDASGRYGNFTTKSDIFSLGMILYFMCFGRLPYQSANAIQEELEDIDLLRAEITDWKGFQDERRERPELPGKLYQLLKKLLSVNPADRPSASEVLTALKNESSLDGVARGARSASPTRGFQSRRVQNLDSPMAPSTPVPGLYMPHPNQNGTLAESQGDPTKQAKVSSSSQEDLSGTIVPGSPRKSAQSAAAQSSLQTHPGAQTARYRATATALSANHDDYSALERRPSEHTLSTSPEAPSPPRSPPLLMAPPTTFFGEVRHRGFVAQHYLAHFAEEHSETTFLFLRLALFLVKMATLTRPCWPYLVNTGIGASLVAVAGLDLGIPGTMQGRGAPRRGSHNVSIAGQQVAPRSRWRWDWKASMTLLALHFAVLWATSRRGVLCPASHAAWPEWT